MRDIDFDSVLTAFAVTICFCALVFGCVRGCEAENETDRVRAQSKTEQCATLVRACGESGANQATCRGVFDACGETIKY